MNNICLVTPVKDEIQNLPRLINCIKNLENEIYLWIIVENDSYDGTKDYLNELEVKLSNVHYHKIINLSFKNNNYDIGNKYSHVVNEGFKYFKNSHYYQEVNYIGILDADTFPEETYFVKLIDTLTNKPKTGLTSGVLFYDNGKREDVNINHIRGTGRLWTKECFEDSGLFYGLSPDSITKTKSVISGWNPQVTKNAKFISRVVNSRGNLSFRGKSSYYNGFSLTYIILKAIYYLYRKPRFTFPLLYGYLSSLLKGAEKNPNSEILDYNNKYIMREIKNKLK